MKTLTLTISQFNTFVKNIFDAEEFLHNISIFGEVTNLKISGGNAYFDLKDQNAMLSCVKFGADDLTIKNGDLITVFGKVNFYVKSGRLNFVVVKTQAYGLGELYQNFLKLKESLEKEGLFRDEIKKPIKRFAKRIGVVTSETGAVIRDIVNVARKKNPCIDIVVYPSRVQGAGAEFEIVKGVEFFDLREDIDTIIIARGGGSFEDLSPFNTEVVARAVFAATKPVISAVGHETDFTICDFASDLRVPTPSVAAEVAVYDYYQTKDHIKQLYNNNYNILKNIIETKKQTLIEDVDIIGSKLKLLIGDYLIKVNSNSARISQLTQIIFSEKKNKLLRLADVISKLNPLEILKAGYSVVSKDNVKILSAGTLKKDDEISIMMSDGRVDAKVLNIKKEDF